MHPGFGAWKRIPPAMLAAAMVLICGCVSVVLHEAPYYVKSPHQEEPPDGYFAPGKNVMVLGEKDSYSRVLTFDAIAAYVWKGSLGTLREWSDERKRIEDAQQEDGR